MSSSKGLAGEWFWAYMAAPEQQSPTVLAYWRDTFELEHTARVVAAHMDNCIVVLDETIFYPTGGGQPADCGCIAPLNGEAGQEIEVVDVRMKDGVVSHTLSAAPPTWLVAGVQVRLRVDGAKRLLHAR